MDIGTALILGVLIGQWIFLFAIWRGVAKLLRLIAELESDAKNQQHVYEIQPNRQRRYYSRDDF